MIFEVILFCCCLNVAVTEDLYKLPPNFNLDDVLNNQRLLKNYLNCILEKGRCTREGQRLKKVIPDALQTDCAKCVGDVKEMSKKILTLITEKYPEEWKELQMKYDPTGEYKKRNKHKLEEIGLNI